MFYLLFTKHFHNQVGNKSIKGYGSVTEIHKQQQKYGLKKLIWVTEY